jgi:hypothetical protein
MKKLFILCISLFVYTALHSQPCLPGGIVFSSQNQINNFQVDYPNCTAIEGDVTISGNDISNLIGLGMVTAIGGDLHIENNPVLSSIVGLDNLASVGGRLNIGGNPVLTSLAGLSSLGFLGGDLAIWDNVSITSLSGLGGLTGINGSVFIGMFSQTGNPSLTSLTGLHHVNSIGGGLYIESNNVLATLSGLDTLQSIGGGFYVQDNHALNDLQGLEDLESIGGALFISFNDVLASLNGLNNLISVGGDLVLLDNASLGSLVGLQNLGIIWGDLNIDGNDALYDISTLDNLTSIGMDLRILGNPSLTSLSGLDNVEPASINDLSIHHNYSLSACAVQSICEYLSNPNGNITIAYNDSGCNDLEEVKDACNMVAIAETSSPIDFLIQPNPCSGAVRLRYLIHDSGYLKSDLFGISGIKIRELVHQEVYPGEYEVEIDVSLLPAGIYFVRMQVSNQIAVRKLVKQ